ncbi:MAG TPA: ABC transporter permease [Solirubrobacteraceae bacterium]|nr:ABC transporter permease [Solirubrobacteraceae bacterium]
MIPIYRLRRMDWLFRLWTGLVFVFLFAPIVTAVVYAFNKGVLGRQTARFTGFTTRWFDVAINDPTLRSSVWVSFRVAIAVAAISAVLGTITGYTIARRRGVFIGRVLEGFVYFLLIVPEIVIAVALLTFYTKVNVELSMATLIAAHTPFSTAVVALIVRSRVAVLDRDIEEAAHDLGAARVRTFWHVLLPQLRSAILAGAILAFTFSFDDLVISLFLSTPTVTTLPVFLFGSLHTGIRPDVFAIATMMLGATLVLLAAAGLTLRTRVQRDSGLTRAVAGDETGE